MANELTYQSAFTGQEMDERFTAVAQLQAALLEVETALSAKYVKPASGIPETDMDAAVQSALAKARSAVQDLSNYYTKTEIDALLSAVNSQEYVDVASLPTASASTLGKIYLVGPTNNQYDRYYTSYDGSDYSWVAAGSTEINLANYATKAELNQLDQEVDGEISDTYTVSGYGNRVGSYDFENGKEYTFVVSSEITGTLYLAIKDSNGNAIRANSAITSFPETFTLTTNSDYEGAYLELGYSSTGTVTVNVSFDGIKAGLKTVEQKVASLETFANPLKEVLVDSDTITAAKVIDYLASGYIYKVVISASTATDAALRLRGVTNEAYRVEDVGVGTYYIPVFNNGVINNIRISASGSFSITYSIYRISFKDFIDANGQLPLNYVKSLSDTLSFTWGQGYHTDYKTLNNNSQWCSTNIQYNRGRKIKVTYSNDYFVRFRHLSVNKFNPYDGSQATSGTTFDTSNFGPWSLSVRKSDYSAITPEEAATAITIEQVSGSVYEVVFGNSSMKDALAPSFDFEARVSALEAAQPINPRLGTLELGRMMHHQNLDEVRPYIPSQSLFDIAYAKVLGFKMIEANLHECSDGVVVVRHGSAGKLGGGLIFAEGSGISADTTFSSVSSTDLRQYVTYDTVWAKYAGHIPTLAEFCSECARLGVVPFLRGCNTTMLAEARKYLPDERIIVEGLATRGDFRGLMTYWGDGATAADILNYCKGKGQPFCYAWSLASSATDSLFEEVAQTLHTNGYLISSAYLSQNKYQKLVKMGLDYSVSTFANIPEFEAGDIFNIVGGNDEKLVLTDSSYDSEERVIDMDNGGTIAIQHTDIGTELAKMCLRIRYNGNLDIRFGSNNDNNRDLVGYDSDGSHDIVIAVALVGTGSSLRIIANAATTIYDIKIAVSHTL